MRRTCWLNWVEQRRKSGVLRDWMQELQCLDSIACEFRTKTLNVFFDKAGLFKYNLIYH